MITSQEMSPVSWTERGEQLRAWTSSAADVVAGPLPRRLGAPSRPPSLAAGRLALRAAFWGVALGLLAPATSVLVLASGLAAAGVDAIGSIDLGFFFGFVPLLLALVVTLLSLAHWPLRDLRAYHRELAIGLLLVGGVALVGLRAHGAAVTSDDWDDAWLFANGSLVLHVLVTWRLVRLATNDLAALHARRAGWRGPTPASRAAPTGPARAGTRSPSSALAPAMAAGVRPASPSTAPAAAGQRRAADPADRPAPAPAAGAGPRYSVGARTRARSGEVQQATLAWDAPRHAATLALALQSIVWGVIVGTATGAAAGTAVRPGLGTLAGGYLGAIYGLVPTTVGTAALVTVVSWRRDTDPHAVVQAVRATLAAVGATVLAAGWPFLHATELPGAAALTAHPERPWLMGAVVVVLLLRQAAPRLAATYVRLVPPAAARPTPATTAPDRPRSTAAATPG